MSFEERMEFLRQSIESHDRQIGELTDKIALLGDKIAIQTANIDKLVQVTNQDAIAIQTLARVAERHERRLDRLDGGSAS